MKQFTNDEDVTLVKEVRATPPFEAEYGKVAVLWDEIAERFFALTNRKVKGRALMDRFLKLVKDYKERKEASRKVSGSGEDLSEKDLLIEEYVDLEATWKRQREKLSPTESSPSLKSLANSRLSLKSPSSDLGRVDRPDPIDASSFVKRTKNSKQAAMAESILEQTKTSRISSEERMLMIKKNVKIERQRLQIEREKVDNETKRLEIESRRFEHDAQLRERQQKIQEEKDVSLINLLNSFASVIEKKLAQ
jgi:hypothetical protein